MKKILTKVLAAAGASLLAGSLLTSPAVADSSAVQPASSPIQLDEIFGTSQPPTLPTNTDSLSEEELQLLNSGAPAVVYQDVETGDITKVEKKSDVSTFALMPAANCSGGITGCLGSRPPNVDYGFIGIGTKSGTWKNRMWYESPGRRMQPCSASKCFTKSMPGQTIVLSQTQTIKSVTVF